MGLGDTGEHWTVAGAEGPVGSGRAKQTPSVVLLCNEEQYRNMAAHCKM